jgi:serine/threonine protein kinase/tetratricopeptide (TPR) repeat protein
MASTSVNAAHVLPPDNPPSSPPLTTADALAARLAEEMIARWQTGERPLVEEFLARHPQLGEHTEAAVELIYEELCLREQFGDDANAADFLRRFPQWRHELEVLLDCHRLLERSRTPPRFPAVGETLGDFRLLAELGRGAQGRVFLASQPTLADRTVVLKLIPWTGSEHLSLARLQHPYIVPLYAVQDDPQRGLRALCMPYLGGATLAQLLESGTRDEGRGASGQNPSPLALRPSPLALTGQQLLDLLGQKQAVAPLALPGKSPARQFLAQATYVQALCWIGACLAEALHYAHERGLVHLDLKPSNVLLVHDGQPMLLDFHLAREPLRPGATVAQGVGGTPHYMSPEQQAALAAMRAGQPISSTVDGRSDIYSLGLVLHKALGGTLPFPEGKRPKGLNRVNPDVSMGLAAIIGKCLEPDPAARYPDAASLAGDLRRHLNHQPLQGVANRSPIERWRKWRRRRPHALPLVLMMLALLAAVGTVGNLYVERYHDAAKALDEGHNQLANRHYEEAINTLNRGLSKAKALPVVHPLVVEFERELRLAWRGKTIQELHGLADRIRFAYDIELRARGDVQILEASCQAMWDKRHLIISLETRGEEQTSGQNALPLTPDVRMDLLDLAILWTDLHTRLAPKAEVGTTHREALAVLAEAESLLGGSPVLYHEHKAHATALRLDAEAQAAGHHEAELPARTAWEHYALGRSLLGAGQIQEAANHFDRALELEPHGLWPNFYQGVCAYRLGHFYDAVMAFSECVGAAPRNAECYYNRALAHDKAGYLDAALRDYQDALKLEPKFAPAAFLNRGALLLRSKRYAEALADLRSALDGGANPVAVHFNLALVYLALEDQDKALSHLERVLHLEPGHGDAKKLRDGIRRRGKLTIKN